MANLLFYVKEAAPTYPLTYDYTTFTEVDEDSDITVTSNVITYSTMRRDASSGVYRDDGADAYSGDFEFQWKWSWNQSSGAGSYVTMFALTEDFYLTKIDKDSGNDGLTVSYSHSNGFYLDDLKGNDSAVKSIVSGPPGTRWLTLTRVGLTCTLYVWMDENRTNPDVGSPISIDHPSTQYSYRWLYAMTSLGSSSSGDRTQSGTVEDLTRIS